MLFRSEIQEQLRYLGSEPDIWQQTCPVRRQDGGQLNLELAGVRLQGGGSRQILLLCREAAAAPPAAEAGALGEVQLAQKRRLEAVGTQVGAMAHDFNNLLASLIMQLELSLGEVPEASHMRANLDDMMESAMQAKDLVRQLAAQPLPAAAASQPEGPVGDRILLVDDEEQLCRLEEKLLQRLGYQVAAFTNSAMALEAFRQDPGGYDLVISDCSMSDLPGLELAQELLRLRPELPIILATGFGETNLLEQAQQIGIRECLEKPILARDLDKAIRRVLEVQMNLFPQN